MCQIPIWTHCNKQKYLFYQEKTTYKSKTKSAQGENQVGLKGGNSTLKKGYIKERISTHFDTQQAQAWSVIVKEKKSNWEEE